MFLLSTIENRVRQNQKNIFCGRKNILKKPENFFVENFQKSKNRKIGKYVENFLDFFQNFENFIIFSKKNYCFLFFSITKN